MKTEIGARLLPVLAVAALANSAASAEQPRASLTAEERWQVKTLQQELHRRDHRAGKDDSQSRLNEDRLRVGEFER